MSALPQPAPGDLPPIALVCGHAQLVAAAIVLSCVPAGQPVLLLVQPPQPHDHAEYQRRFAVFRELFDRRNELIGGGIGWAEAGADGRTKLRELQAAVDGAMFELGPYRSWYAHQSGLGRLAHRLAPRLVLLLSPQLEARLTLAGVSRDDIADGQSRPLLPDGTPTHTLDVPADGDGEAWLQSAWPLLRPGEPPPERRVDFDRGDLASCLCALREALDAGVPLREVAPARAATSAVHHAALAADAAEVVLLEAAAEADLLLGVLYAARQSTGVIAYPRPPREAVDAALAAVETTREDASKRAESMLAAGVAPEGSAEPDRPKLIGRLLQWMRSRRTGALGAITQAVSAAVPREVTRLVAGAAVTVLTDGLPYRFVRHGDIDWADKPIGHIAGDRALLLLGALHPQPPLPVATFDMLFDPGFFDDTDETRDVINALAGRRSYALVLKGDVGSSDSLLNLTGELPVELVYFNTHGSRDGILLSDQLVPSFKLAQWLNLPSRPVVFNSSCLSWLGVGTQFVRCGASGYVGTLWSVAADDAATLARLALHRMVREGVACSAALCDTGVDASTSMAYLFVGTATQRLQAAEQQAMPAAQRARSHALSLLDAAQDRLGSHGQLRSDDHRRALVSRLLQEADRMIDDLLQLDASSRETLELLVRRIVVLSALPAEEVAARLGPLLDDAESRLAPLGPAEPLAWRLAIYRALWLERGQHLTEALDHLRAITLPPDADTLVAASVERARSELAKKTNHPQEAHDAARRALEINRRVAGDNRGGVMASLGHLVQATLRLEGREAEAVEAAHQGLAVARDLHNESEQVIFELDIARIEQIRGHPELAEPHARSALARARRSFDNVGELACVGSLCNILIATGKLDEAESLVKLGLNEAAGLQRWSSVGDFLANLAEIENRRQQPERAFAAILAASRVLAAHGPYERLQSHFQWVHRWAATHAPDHPELPVVELAFVVAQQGESPALHWAMARDASALLHAWARRLTAAPPAALLERVLAHEPPDKINGPGSVIGMTLRLLHALATAQRADAQAWATRLDQALGNAEAGTTLQHALAHWCVPGAGHA